MASKTVPSESFLKAYIYNNYYNANRIHFSMRLFNNRYGDTFLKKLWCCVGGRLLQGYWYYQLN